MTVGGVAIMSRAAYSLIGRAIPDSRDTLVAGYDATGVHEVRNESACPETVLTADQTEQAGRITYGGEQH